MQAVHNPELVERVRAIRPILAANRTWADDNARMAPASCEAACDAGVFKLFAPLEGGGHERPLPEILAVFEELGYSDPTVGWHASNSGAFCLSATTLIPEAQAEIFAGNAGPYGLSVAASGRAVPVEGGYRFGGLWPFMTGVMDATWAVVSGLVRHEVPQEGGPDVRAFIIPSTVLQPHTTWTAAVAMRGTGSHAVEVTDVFVPERFVLRPGDSSRIQRPLFRLPNPVAGLTAAAAMSVGIARQALDEATALAAAKKSRADGLLYRERPYMQATVGVLHAQVEVLSAGLRAAAEAVWNDALAGPVSPLARGRLWTTAFWTLDQARGIVSELMTISTSAVYSQRNPIEMALRDVHAITAALETNRGLQAAYGRVRFGMDPGLPNY